jgi:hypothetical protein
VDGSCANIYGAPVNKIDIGHVNIECATSWLSRARKFSAEESKFRADDRLSGNYPENGVLSGLATNRQEPELRPAMRLNERIILLATFEFLASE